MDGQYYKNPKFPTIEEEEQEETIISERFEDLHNYTFNNLLKDNKTKFVKVFSNNGDYEGYIEQIGNDFLVLADDKKRIVLFISDIEHIEFNDDIKYKSVLENI